MLVALPHRAGRVAIMPASLLCLVTLLAVGFAARPAQAQVMLISNYGNNTVGEYNATTGATINATFINSGQGLSNPRGVALDGSDHLFVANQNNTVGQYNASTGATINTTFINNGQGVSNPSDLALDGNNHLFAANYNNFTVGQYNASSGATIDSSFIGVQDPISSPAALALDGNNHLFVVEYNRVGEFDATTGATINAAFIGIDPGSSASYGIALDADNHLFLSFTSNNTVGEYDATTGATLNAAFINGQGTNEPTGLGLDGHNHLFVSNFGNNTVGEYDATTGATINAAFINGQGLNSPGYLVFATGVPEPSSAVLAGLGLLCMAVFVRQGQRQHAIDLRGAKSRIFCLPILFCSTFLVAPLAASAATIPVVPVGNVGNDNDSFTGNLYGGVSYAYRIGTTEVTNAQYADFLNAKGASDPLALYSTSMGSEARGGIARSGVSGSFTYSVRTNMGDKPVNYVSWYDSIRFANWLNNGQGTGDTETGAYSLGALGADGVPTNGNSITRNVGAKWFLPSESEWYKAAYYQPAAQGGPPENYWIFATGVNITIAHSNSVGDISNSGNNVVNYQDEADWNAQNGNVTTVGSAGPLSPSFYGTLDQSGNVWEWNEALFNHSTVRGARGGSWDSLTEELWSSYRNGQPPTTEDDKYGFRVATISVPEPSSVVLAACGLLGVFVCFRRSSAVKMLARLVLISLIVAAGSATSFAITYTTLDFPGGKGTSVFGVDGNVVVGVYADAGGPGHGHGFLYNGTTWTTLSEPAATLGTTAYAISGNNVAGRFKTRQRMASYTTAHRFQVWTTPWHWSGT